MFNVHNPEYAVDRVGIVNDATDVVVASAVAQEHPILKVRRTRFKSALVSELLRGIPQLRFEPRKGLGNAVLRQFLSTGEVGFILVRKLDEKGHFCLRKRKNPQETGIAYLLRVRASVF